MGGKRHDGVRLSEGEACAGCRETIEVRRLCHSRPARVAAYLGAKIPVTSFRFRPVLWPTCTIFASPSGRS